MSFAGYLTTLRASGIPTTMANEAMSPVGGSSTFSSYQIDSTTRRVWDRKVTFTFQQTSSTGSTIASTAIVDINYLYGKVTFNATQSTAIVVTGTYMPMSAVAGAHSYTLNQVTDVLDDTDFSSTGFKSKRMGLHDISLSLNRWEPLDNTFTKMWLGSSTSSTAVRLEPVVAEINPGGSTLTARGWFVVENDNKSGDVSGLEEASVSLQIDGNERSAFRWSDQ